MNNNDNLLSNIVNFLAFNEQPEIQTALNNILDSLNPHHQFDPTHPHGIIIGNPSEEITHWHQQISPQGCAIAVQQSGIEHITNQSVSQEKLLHQAEIQGLYNPNIGTNAEDFGKLLAQEAHVPVGS